MDFLSDLQEKLSRINETETELLIKQKEIEARLKELRIQQAVYEELVMKYAHGISGHDERRSSLSDRMPESEAFRPAASYAPQQPYGQPAYPQQSAPAPQQAQGYPISQQQPVYTQQQGYVQQHVPQQQPTYTLSYSSPQSPQQQPYAPPPAQDVYAQPPTQAAAPARSVEARPRYTSPRPSVSSGPKRMSSQITAEIWLKIREILSDGSSWQVGDLRSELEERMDIGEINRTTLQSILKRNEAALDRSEKGYVKLMNP